MSIRNSRLSRHTLLATLLATLIAASLFTAGCGTRSTAPLAAGGSAGVMRAAASPERELGIAEAAQQRATDALMARAGVAGTGASLDATGRAQVVVLLESDHAGPLPREVDGVPVVGLVVGTVHPWSLTGSYRPVPVGVSAGNANECLPGTIGCVLQRGTRRFLLSANHVFARQNRAAIGEAIVQPSLPDLDPACGPAPASAFVATLSDFQPVVYDGKTPNVMDAAIAEFTLPPSQLSCATPRGYYGFPGGTVAAPQDGMAVMKLGRTTEWTHGRIKAVNVKIKITFPSGTALFTGQVLTSPGFGDFGDSGSLVVTDDGARSPVGMLIGGGNNGSAIVSPIGPILARFSATVCTH